MKKDAPQGRNMLQEAPSFFGKHLNYFKDKYPDYFCEEEIANGSTVAVDLVLQAHHKMIDVIHNLFIQGNFK